MWRSAIPRCAISTRSDGAQLATAGLTEKDIKVVLVPNVVRSADDFVSGAADMFNFAFGAPKVREVDATVGGIRVLEIDEKGMPEARKIMPYGYLTQVGPGPVFIGVEKPMKVYSFDALIFSSAKVPDDFVYKFLEALDKNKADLVAIQPVLREFTLAFAYKNYDIPYHPGAVKYYKEHNVQANGIAVNGEPQQPEAAEQSSAASPAVALATDILQGALIFCVVGWVLDVPRRLFDMSFYTEQLLAVCLGFGLALSFITTSTAIGSRIRIMRWLDWFAAVASLIICGYIAYRYDALTYEIALLPIDGVIGSAILLLLVLEATRRTSGGVLVVIILILTLYVFIGPHMPGDFATRPVSPARLITYLGLDTNGMIGIILSVALLIVVPFTLMGQVLGSTGGAALFRRSRDVGNGAFPRRRGQDRGVWLRAVRHDLRRRGQQCGSGRHRHHSADVAFRLFACRAAAIESVGSTGGQLMPPVMGAAAFIMAEFLQVSYGAVCIAAVIPSLLYYAALFIHVDLEAAKHKIGAAQVAETSEFAEVSEIGLAFPDPAGVPDRHLAYPEIFQIPIERAADLCHRHPDRTEPDLWLSRHPGDILGRCCAPSWTLAALARYRPDRCRRRPGGRALSVSGISFGLTLQLIALSGGSLFVLLILTAIISIILGMGMPTVSVYVLTATLLAPSLIKLGVTPMAAHMYVMYFGMLRMITPPVAIAAYAAANIARVSGWTTGWTAVVVGWSTFFIPFLFVLEPSLLMEGSAGLIAWNFARNILGIFVGTAGIVGFAFGLLALPMRIAFGAAALAILIPHMPSQEPLSRLDRARERYHGAGG